MHYKLDGRNVVPCDWREWAMLLEHPRARLIARQVIGPHEITVSTIFLGLDHGFGLNRPPLVFETMVFGGPLEGEMARYATFEEAEVGHAEMVARVRAVLASMGDEAP